jgi:hypothetical protein
MTWRQTCELTLTCVGLGALVAGSFLWNVAWGAYDLGWLATAAGTSLLCLGQAEPFWSQNSQSPGSSRRPGSAAMILFLRLALFLPLAFVAIFMLFSAIDVGESLNQVLPPAIMVLGVTLTCLSYCVVFARNWRR